MTSDAPDRDLTASEAGAGEGGDDPRPDPSGPASSGPDGGAMDSDDADREPTTPTAATGDTPGTDGEAPSAPPASAPPATSSGDTSSADGDPAAEPEPATPVATTGDPPGAAGDPDAPIAEAAAADRHGGDGVDGPVPGATMTSTDDDGPEPTAATTTSTDDDGPEPTAATTMTSTDDDGPEPTAATTTTDVVPPPRRRGLPAWAKVVAGIAVLAFLGGAYWLGQRGASQADAPATTATTATTAVAEGDDPEVTSTTTEPFELAEYEDSEAGFSFSYPAEWERLELTGDDPTVRLVLSAGGQDSLLVRVEPLEGEVVTDQQLIDFNAVTDALIADEGARVLQEQQVELGGLPGFYYLYQFTDEETGLEGAHVHYFLFQGSTMYVLVFQALPTVNFEPLVPAFDVVTESFRVDAPDDDATTTTAPDAPDGATTTTTAPPTTPTS